MSPLLVLGVLAAALGMSAPVSLAAGSPDGPAAGSGNTIPGEGSDTSIVLPDTVAETTPQIVGSDSGAATPDPVLAPSAPLIQTPSGCATPPVASVVFVGNLVAKDRNTARYEVVQVRAGNADAYIVTGLVDVRYEDETQYLSVDSQYLVGAAPSATNAALSSKVRASALLFGGNAVIGVTEKNSECPLIEDPLRTLHVDGTEVENSLFTGLKDSKRRVALAFAEPLAVAFAVILVLALIRWLFTAFFVSVRHAADVEPITPVIREPPRVDREREPAGL